jgi:hypothetical protein
MTPNKAIEKVDRVKPNSYSEEDKLGWINELEGMVKRLVFQWDEKYLKELEAKYKSGELTEEQYKELVDKTKLYAYPDDMDKELLIQAPFDDVYTLFLEAKIDYYNREYSNYNNSAMMFEAQFSEYKKDYIRHNQARG